MIRPMIRLYFCIRIKKCAQGDCSLVSTVGRPASGIGRSCTLLSQAQKSPTETAEPTLNISCFSNPSANLGGNPAAQSAEDHGEGLTITFG